MYHETVSNLAFPGSEKSSDGISECVHGTPLPVHHCSDQALRPRAFAPPRPRPAGLNATAASPKQGIKQSFLDHNLSAYLLD